MPKVMSACFRLFSQVALQGRVNSTKRERGSESVNQSTSKNRSSPSFSRGLHHFLDQRGFHPWSEISNYVYEKQREKRIYITKFSKLQEKGMNVFFLKY